jgi:hypothetical protein
VLDLIVQQLRAQGGSNQSLIIAITSRNVVLVRVV